MKRQTSHHTSIRSRAMNRGAEILVEAFLRSRPALAVGSAQSAAPPKPSPVEEMEDVLPWIGEGAQGPLAGGR